ncbi:MAG: inorganic phosphate transporter [Deltaproteobacteria bacterium]|nr:inorganic phosphate transporter [Deltaproteobacteria bacterium]
MEAFVPFIPTVGVLSLFMLIWACIEVGSNDAANLVNAVFGSRVLRRNVAVLIAGLFVVVGANFSSPVMDTVRKGIFDLSFLDSYGAIVIFVSVYLVNTVLLYSFSAYGLPVSTTATLVFALAGGALGISGNSAVVDWPTMGRVTAAILASILLSGLAGFLLQRIFRGAMRTDARKPSLVLLHGPWITGIILASLSWFMVVKGMNAMPIVRFIQKSMFNELGTGGFLLLLWGGFTLLTHIILAMTGRWGIKYLFHVTSILGMICMAFAFGQNDLANCASPGLAIWMIWQKGLQAGSSTPIPDFALLICGLLMAWGMTTKRAHRVTRAEVNTGSQQSRVSLYAPRWCMWLARFFINKNNDGIPEVAPPPGRDDTGKKIHYDPLRASVILAVGACVIALASGLGLPVSTTYVSFAAVIATGWGDRVFSRGKAEVKIGRALWVVTSWFLGMGIALVATGAVALFIYHLGLIGLVGALFANLFARYYFYKKGEAHEELYHGKKPGSASSSVPGTSLPQVDTTAQGLRNTAVAVTSVSAPVKLSVTMPPKMSAAPVRKS